MHLIDACKLLSLPLAILSLDIDGLSPYIATMQEVQYVSNYHPLLAIL